MSPISTRIKRFFYIFKYILITSWTGKMEHINGRVIRDLDHLLKMNDVLKILGVQPLERDLYLTVRR